MRLPDSSHQGHPNDAQANLGSRHMVDGNIHYRRSKMSSGAAAQQLEHFRQFPRP